MKIFIKRPLDCPLRELTGRGFTCGAITVGEIICDNDDTDDFPFPDDCPLKRDKQITIHKVSDD